MVSWRACPTYESVTCVFLRGSSVIAGTSWVFVQMVLTAGIGMQSCLDLHLLWKKSFRRFSSWVLSTMAPQTGFFKTATHTPNKQKNLRLCKVPMLSIWVQLQNRQPQRLLMCSNNKFNRPNNRSARPRCKIFPMACLIRRTKLLHHFLKEYLGVLRVLRFFIRSCKLVLYFFWASL